MSVTLERVSQDSPAARVRPKPRLKLTWEHAGLGAVLLLAGFLGLWNLTVNNYSNEYYASAVRSMMQSWHNFFFASFDPGGFVTVDKPPVAFWIQTAFAKVFGFNGVSLLLPEALAGIGGVFLLYIMVKKAWGAAAGLVAALMLAITPIWVVMNRDNNPDSLLVFTLLLAAWALFRAAEKGRLRWLMVASVLVGVAFNIKMMEAYVVLPAFYAMYFFLARTGWRKRILHLTLATIVIAVVSLSWAVAVDLTPASQRPYVGSSSTNSELDLILNYNGLGRVDGTENAGGGTRPSGQYALTDGSQPTTTGGTSTATAPTAPDGGNFTPPTGNGGQQGGPGGNGFGGQAGATRLIIPSLAGEFNWFMPLALLGTLYLGLYAFRMAKGEERSRRLQSVVLWGGWWLVYGLVFSFSKGIFHNYYLIIMAPAQAALAGVTLVMLWKRYRQGGWQAYLLTAALVATALYQAYILTGYTSWNWWLGPVLIVAGLVGAVGLIVARRWRYERFGRGLALGLVGTTTAFLLATPAAWSVRAVFTSLTGSIVSAEPGGQGGGMPFGDNNNSSEGISTWLNFIGQNLVGELIILAALVVVVALVIGAARLLRGRRLMSAPIVAGVLLALFLAGSTGWWVNAAQAKTTTASTTARSGMMMQGGFGGPGGQDQANSGLISYLEANQGDYTYLVAVSSSQSADSIIISTGKAVMALGGFSGSDKIITSTAQLEQLIASHSVRYFLIGGQGGGPDGSSNVVTQYVEQSCKVVNSSAYSSTTTSSSTATTTSATDATTTGGRSMGGMGGSQTLYVCGS